MSTPATPGRLPDKAADTTAEQPWPLRLLSMKIGDYVDRMSPVWVEGQLVQVNRRPGSPTVFLTLRDIDAEISMSVTTHVNTLNAMGPAVQTLNAALAQQCLLNSDRHGTFALEAGRIVEDFGGLGPLKAGGLFQQETGFKSVCA